MVSSVNWETHRDFGTLTARGGEYHKTRARRLIPMPVKEFAAQAA